MSTDSRGSSQATGGMGAPRIGKVQKFAREAMIEEFARETRISP
jgi:hypothetical protein